MSTGSDLVALLAEAGLTGRGGAGFSTATKLEAAHRYGARVIVNACDGELGAVKDAWVVANNLDEMVEGARMIAGRADPRVLYAAHRGSPTETRLLAAGLDVLDVPARYVSSEESALISAAHGGLARPMTKRAPFVTGGADSRGKRIRPTLVLNAETSWRVAQIARHGASWFRSFGTVDEPGPRLVSIHGLVRHPGVIETQAGVPVRGFLAAAGAWVPDDAGILVGGLSGVFLAAAEAAGATWSSEDLRAYDGAVGPGVIEVLDPRHCPLDLVVRRLAYAAGESAGQCGPCMFGLPALASDFAALVTRPDPGALDRVRGRLGLLRDRGACRFPDGASRFTASALRVYAGHLEEHAAGPCPLRARSHHAVSA